MRTIIITLYVAAALLITAGMSAAHANPAQLAECAVAISCCQGEACGGALADCTQRDGQPLSGEELARRLSALSMAVMSAELEAAREGADLCADEGGDDAYEPYSWNVAEGER